MSTAYLPEFSEWKNYCKKVKINTGIELSYIELGNKDKDPLILVHGYSDSSQAYRTIIKGMQDEYHIFAVDMRGHGYSDKPKQFAYTIMQNAADIIAFADAMGIDKFYLAGQSMGSQVSQAICFSAPDRVIKAALISTFARFQDTPEQVDEFDKMFDDWFKNGVDEDSFWPAKKNFADPNYTPAARLLLDTWPAYCWKAAWWGMEVSDNRNFLQYIKAPIIMMWGTEDDIADKRLQDEIKPLLPNARVEIFDGKGHELLQEAPSEIACILKDFFK